MEDCEIHGKTVTLYYANAKQVASRGEGKGGSVGSAGGRGGGSRGARGVGRRGRCSLISAVSYRVIAAISDIAYWSHEKSKVKWIIL